jgi:hypothetical protein
MVKALAIRRTLLKDNDVKLMRGRLDLRRLGNLTRTDLTLGRVSGQSWLRCLSLLGFDPS